MATEKVKYTQRVDYIMQLPVPMEAALNKGQRLQRVIAESEREATFFYALSLNWDEESLAIARWWDVQEA